MPLYEYKCRACGQTFEVLQRFSDKPVEVHQGCGGEVERLISTSAFQFKGSGFYITDYAKGHDRKPGNGRDAKTDPASKPASDKPADKPASEKAAPKPVESKPASTSSDSSSKA